jgi:hypothetical protein
MVDLVEGRRLAIKLGFLNADGTPGWRSQPGIGPDVLCLYNTPQARLDELRAQGFNPVFDPVLSGGPTDARIVTDPTTGRREYIAARESYVYAAAASSSPVGSPPVIMEKPRNMWLTGQFEINRFSLNPARDSVLQQLNERDLVGPPPEMFGNTALPMITGSGVDPQVLRHVAWQLRTSAAFVSSRAQILEMIIASQELAVDETLQTEVGRAYLNAYFSSVQSWASVIPEGDSMQDMSPAEIKAFYPEGAELE